MGVEGGQHEGPRRTPAWSSSSRRATPRAARPRRTSSTSWPATSRRRVSRWSACPWGGGGADGLQRGPQDRAAVRQGRGDLRVLRRGAQAPHLRDQAGLLRPRDLPHLQQGREPRQVERGQEHGERQVGRSRRAGARGHRREGRRRVQPRLHLQLKGEAPPRARRVTHAVREKTAPRRSKKKKKKKKKKS